MEAKAISEERRRQIGRIGARLKLVFLAVARCLLPGNVQEGPYDQEIASLRWQR